MQLKRRIVKAIIWIFQVISVVVLVLFTANWICGTQLVGCSKVPDYAQVLVAVIASMMIIIQLNQEKELEKQQNEIEESKLILQFNQSFIQDKDMCKAEAKLEESFIQLEMGQSTRTIVKNKNRNIFTNYLVYLESLAMFINNGHVRIEKVDDLMAYRFFIALNNKELQEKEICDYADYYRACIKVHDKWRKYRLQKGYPIPNEEWGLEIWEDYEKYIDHTYTVLSNRDKDFKQKFGDKESNIAAKLIFHSDQIFYQPIFDTVYNLEKLFVQMKAYWTVNSSNSNIYVAFHKKMVVGIAIVYDFNDKQSLQDKLENLEKMPNTFEKHAEEFHNEIMQYVVSEKDVYIVCLAINNHTTYKFERIDEILLKSIIRDNEKKNIYTHITIRADEKKLNLYKKYSFCNIDNQEKGEDSMVVMVRKASE